MNPLEERERLIEQERRASRMGAEASHRIQRLKVEERKATDAQSDAYALRARGNAEAERAIKEADKNLQRIFGELRQAEAESNGAVKALDAIRRERDDLLKRELTAFTAEAEQLSEEAEAAFAELTELLALAQEKWMLAHAHWAALSVPLREAVNDAELRAGNHRGDDWLRAVVRTPVWPLPGELVEQVRSGQVRPRPPVAILEMSLEPAA